MNNAYEQAYEQLCIYKICEKNMQYLSDSKHETQNLAKSLNLHQLKKMLD